MRLYKAIEETSPSFCGLCWTNKLNVQFQQARKYDQLWTEPWVRWLDIERIAARLPVPTPGRQVAGGVGRAALAAFDRAAAGVGLGQIEQLHAPDARFDELDARIGPLQAVSPQKTAAYVRWKYFDWPGLRTTVFGYRQGDQLRGAIVLREPEARGESGRVLDVIVDPREGRVAFALVARALRHYRDRKVTRVECIATSRALQRVLRSLLFVPRPPALPLFFLNGHKVDGVEHLRSVENWNHHFGDSEGGEVP
jgi:hypothetical protein